MSLAWLPQLIVKDCWLKVSRLYTEFISGGRRVGVMWVLASSNVICTPNRAVCLDVFQNTCVGRSGLRTEMDTSFGTDWRADACLGLPFFQFVTQGVKHGFACEFVECKVHPQLEVETPGRYPTPGDPCLQENKHHIESLLNHLKSFLKLIKSYSCTCLL